MRLLAALLPLAAALGLAPAPAAAADDLVIDGRGWGHGVGLSQYGAYGYALREGRDFRWILGHYYTGTALGSAPPSRMRVLLRRTRAPKVCDATALRDARGRRVRLSTRRTYRVTAWGATGLRLTDTTTGRSRARVQAPARVTGGPSTCLRGTAENGLRDGFYRGALRLHRDGSAVMVVNDVSLEQYLYGVVPAEMPASWPAEALKAQAVVARSYALRGRRPAEPFDVYADVRSQVYRGVAAEIPASTAAVRATRAQVVMWGAAVAQTFFFSTSGGRTAANEEGFGGAPIPYLRAVDDPYDDLSPVHEWTVRIPFARAERMLDEVTTGDLVGVRVVATTPTGRAAIVEVEGSGATEQVSGATIRRLLELRSTWFTVAREPEPGSTPTPTPTPTG